MHVVISGSRHWKRDNVDQIEDRILELADEHWKAGDVLQIAHGKSKGGGVDLYVAEICMAHNIIEWPYPVRADLDGNHRGAPINRNHRMIRGFMPDLVLAFRSAGKSNGTDDALSYAQKLGIPTETVHERD